MEHLHYDELQYLLERAAAAMGPAECHGYLCGLRIAQAPVSEHAKVLSEISTIFDDPEDSDDYSDYEAELADDSDLELLNEVASDDTWEDAHLSEGDYQLHDISDFSHESLGEPDAGQTTADRFLKLRARSRLRDEWLEHVLGRRSEQDDALATEAEQPALEALSPEALSVESLPASFGEPAAKTLFESDGHGESGPSGMTASTWPDDSHDVLADRLVDVWLRLGGVLESGSFEFTPLLPDDAQPLSQRTQMLGEWCAGFLLGMGLAGDFNAIELSEQGSEALSDLSEISRIVPDSVADEEAEHAFAEVLEYVRVAVLLIWEECRAVRSNANGQTIH